MSMAVSFLVSVRRIWEKRKTIRYKPDNWYEEEEKFETCPKSSLLVPDATEGKTNVCLGSCTHGKECLVN